MMAAAGCSAISFFSTCKRSFYFKAKGDLEEDCFEMTEDLMHSLFQCNDSKLLLLKAKTFQAEHIAQPHSDCKFIIRFFRNNSSEERAGRAVMLYIENKEGTKMIVCCDKNHDIVAEEMRDLSNIPESQHKAIFYMTNLPTSYCMFESSLYPSRFLGFHTCDACPSLRKLTLCQKGKTEVDESCNFLLRDCDK